MVFFITFVFFVDKITVLNSIFSINKSIIIYSTSSVCFALLYTNAFWSSILMFYSLSEFQRISLIKITPGASLKLERFSRWKNKSVVENYCLIWNFVEYMHVMNVWKQNVWKTRYVNPFIGIWILEMFVHGKALKDCLKNNFLKHALEFMENNCFFFYCSQGTI